MSNAMHKTKLRMAEHWTHSVCFDVSPNSKRNTTLHFSDKTISKIPNKPMHFDELTCTSKRIDGGASRLVPTAVIPWTT